MPFDLHYHIFMSIRDSLIPAAQIIQLRAAMLKDKAARLLPALRPVTAPAGRRAVTSVEYAIIAGVLAVVIVASVTAIGPELANTFNKVATPL